MSRLPYPYKHPHPRRYIFTSEGKARIEKVVDFQSTGIRNVMNLSFGDLLEDGSLNDRVNSNNGDIIKVLTTVVDILKSFTSRYPDVEVFFTGSTNERTRLYARILKTYYASFSTEFSIFAITGTEIDNDPVPFDPSADLEYLGFLIKRIN
jgi:hypothetical protein